jgi:hypothetical protein
VFQGMRLNELEKLILRTLNNQGDKMAELDDKLNALKASLEAAFTRAQTDLDNLKTMLENMGHLSPEVTALIDGMISRAESFDPANPPTPQAIQAAP